MSDLPKPGSEWIRRSDCEVVDVIGASSGYVSYMAHGTEEIDALADFRRDFIEQGPVTLERLEAVGWRVFDGRSAVCGPLYFTASDGVEVEAHEHVPLPGCTSMLGVLWAMRLFVTP